MNEDSSNLFFMNPSNAGLFPSNTEILKNVAKISGLELFYTTNVKDLSNAFSSLFKLESIDLSSWELPNLEDMRGMFQSNKLKEINITNWHTPKVVDASAAFSNIAALMDKTLTGIENIIGFNEWELPSLTSLSGTFAYCKNIKELNLTKWNVSKVESFQQTFSNSNLVKLDISNWDTSKATSFSRFFENCPNLKQIKLGPNFSVYGDGTITEENKFVLPASSGTGADGNWYTFNGDSYAPNAIQDRTAATYYATYDMVANMDVVCKNGSLIDIAKAIREKNGTTDKYTLSQMADAIHNLS